MDEILNLSDKEMKLKQKNEELSLLENEDKLCDEQLKDFYSKEQGIGGN